MRMMASCGLSVFDTVTLRSPLPGWNIKETACPYASLGGPGTKTAERVGGGAIKTELRIMYPSTCNERLWLAFSFMSHGASSIALI
jgi:hypothetical protein